jgi:hypothetical protein
MIRKQTILKTSLATALCFSFTSCATLFTRSKYDVRLNSYPQNATFKVVDAKGRLVATGITPATVRLKAGGGFFKRGKYLVSMNKSGYYPVESIISSEYDANNLLNLFSWGLYGFALDGYTGAMWKFGDGYSVTLDPKAVDVPRNVETTPPPSNNNNTNNNQNQNQNNNTISNTNNNQINIVIDPALLKKLSDEPKNK